MKNTLRIDHTDKVIIMDRTFAKNAENTRSEEYRHLQAVRQDYPEYGVVRKQIKKAEHKESHLFVLVGFPDAPAPHLSFPSVGALPSPTHQPHAQPLFLPLQESGFQAVSMSNTSVPVSLLHRDPRM